MSKMEKKTHFIKLEKTQQTGNSSYERGFTIMPRPLAEISTTTKSKTI